MTFLRRVLHNLPNFILAFILAVAVWISAVTSSDPSQERLYPHTLTIDLVGQDPGMLITSSTLEPVTLMMNAPRSVWDRINADPSLVRAVVDLSGLAPGSHMLPVQVQVGTRLARIVSYNPSSVHLTLEPLISRSLPIRVTQRGEAAVGFQADTPALSQPAVTVSGPQSKVNRVQEVQAEMDISQAREALTRTLTLQALDANQVRVEGVTLNPEKVTVNQPVTQLGGYRNVVVKVRVTGQITNGYRLTNIFVTPPTVTVFSNDPQLVNNLPGFVETVSLDLSGMNDDRDLRLPLNLPQGISVVGDPTVLVQVGVAAIQGSITLNNVPVMVSGLAPNLAAKISPEKVDVILSGPLALLERITVKDVNVVVDMTDAAIGKYQRTPRVVPAQSDVRVESALPATIEVTVTQAPALTPTPTIKR